AWTTQTTAAGGFRFDLPDDWTLTATPGQPPSGARTVVADPSGTATFTVIEGISGLGGACGPGGTAPDESPTLLRLPVPGLNIASPSTSSQTPSVTVKMHGPALSYTVKDVKPASGVCDLYPFFQWQPVGTSGFSASVNTSAYDTSADPTMTAYLNSQLHAQLMRIFLSIKAQK
ncbi:MAG: hypothetical protein M3021_03070, partial [Actinomycetota bacterium]|nr:hypothetical protein [Actinomycetota bacterium]